MLRGLYFLLSLRVMKLNPPKIHWLILTAVTLLAATFRFYHLKSLPPGLYPDEAMNGVDALNALATHQFQVFYPANNGREGLFIFLQALSLAVFHTTQAWVLRFPSAVLGTLTVPVFYLFLRELAEAAKLKMAPLLALVASFLLATSYWHLTFSRMGFRAILAPLFACLALYAVLVALRRQTLPFFLVAGVVMGLGAYTYTAFRVVPLILLVFLVAFRPKISQVLAYLGATLITLIPLLHYFNLHPDQASARTQEVSVFSQPNTWELIQQNTNLTVHMFFTLGDQNWRHNFSGNPEVVPLVALFLVFGLMLAVYRRSLLDWTLVTWLVVAALPEILSIQSLPHALRGILMLPPVLALAASGFSYFWQLIVPYLKKPIAAVVLAFLASALTIDVYHTYFVDYARNSAVPVAFTADFLILADQINQLPSDQPKLVVLTADRPGLCAVSICAADLQFLTGTYNQQTQAAKQLQYISYDQYLNQPISPTTKVFFLR